MLSLCVLIGFDRAIFEELVGKGLQIIIIIFVYTQILLQLS